MHCKGQFPTSLFRTIFLLAIVIFIVAAAAIPAFAQNSVPPTAVQAAKMPQYASRLAHPARRLAAPKSQVFARATKHRGPLDPSDIYDNGPINGNTDAWTINFGFILSDSFTIANDQTQITGMSFGAWLFSGDTAPSVEVSITSLENGGTSYFDQTVNFTESNCTVNQYGYNICTETGAFSGPTLNAGTYWVNLQNASVPSGDPVYWDENSGVGCQGQGCPSLASENSIGSIPSEAFTILGNTTTSTSSTAPYSSCPEAQPGFRDLYDFPAGSSPSGVVLGGAGKLYGTVANGGSYGAGQVFDLADRGASWFFSSLYSFLGGSNGSGPNGVIVGPEGVLYGAASGGSGYGLIYKATPPPTACATVLCNWNETTIYQFTSESDAAGGTVTAFDSAGNLYGISGLGGADGQGAVFELSPSQEGWTEKVLYSFTGGSDGGGPNSLLLGHDGNLYGTAGGGGNNGCWDGYGPCGVVFQLVPWGGGWRENVIYAFTGSSGDGWWPHVLIQDATGGLIGSAICPSTGGSGCQWEGAQYEGVIFGVRRSGNSGWQFSQVSQYRGDACYTYGSDFVTYSALALDGAGNLYAVAGGGLDYWCGAVLNITSETQLVGGFDPIFDNLASDANGNLYGTISTCGFGTPQRNTGMIWQYYAVHH